MAGTAGGFGGISASAAETEPGAASNKAAATAVPANSRMVNSNLPAFDSSRFGARPGYTNERPIIDRQDAAVAALAQQAADNIGVPNRIRTGVAAVKGRCPGPLDDGDGRRRRGHGLPATAAEINTGWALRSRQPRRRVISAARSGVAARGAQGSAMSRRIYSDSPDLSSDRFSGILASAWRLCEAVVDRLEGHRGRGADSIG